MQRNVECEMQRIKRTAFGGRKAQKRDAERKKNTPQEFSNLNFK